GIGYRCCTRPLHCRVRHPYLGWPAVLPDGGFFHRFAVSPEPVAPLGNGAAVAGLTQVVWPDAGECAGVAAVFGGVGSSSGMTSCGAARLPLVDERVSAKTVECRDPRGATAAVGLLLVILNDELSLATHRT